MFINVNNCRFLLSDYLNLNQFVLSSLFVLLVFSYFYTKNFKRELLGNIGFGLIIIGGMMNLSQWSKYGCVHDFINFFGLFFFNCYDLMITVGIILVAITIWKKK
ncbi:MAG: signal peptidase II [Patescibacteria group bacterium]